MPHQGRQRVARLAWVQLLATVSVIGLGPQPAFAAEEPEILIYAGGSGQAGSARGTELGRPADVIAAPEGAFYFADSERHRIRKVDARGAIQTIAGTGEADFADGTAVGAKLNEPQALALGPDGSIYVADTRNDRVRRIDAAGVMQTVVGCGFCGGDSGSGPDATNAKLSRPQGVAVDVQGHLYVSDTVNHRILEIIPGPDGVVNGGSGESFSTLAGKEGCGAGGYDGDDKPATQACLASPRGVAISGSAVYFADSGNHRIRLVDAGQIHTAAGSGACGAGGGYQGDESAATDACLKFPSDVSFDGTGRLYIADTQNHRVRVVTSGVISTAAGIGQAGFSPYDEGVAASTVHLKGPTGVAAGAQDSILIADSENSRIRRVVNGIARTVAGLSCCFFKGDGGFALDAALGAAEGVANAGADRMCVADSVDQRVRCINSEGVIVTEIGSGAPGGLPFTVPASIARLNDPSRLAFDDERGILYISNPNGAYIAAVDRFGQYSIVWNGKGREDFPYDLAVDKAGRIYARVFYQFTGMIRILRIDPNAGGKAAVPIIEGPCQPPNVEQTGWDAATSAGEWAGAGPRVACPGGVVLDSSDNLYVSDSARHVIWKGVPSPACNSPGVRGYCLERVAGTVDAPGNRDGSAPQVLVNGPGSLTIDDSRTHIFFLDGGNGVIRKIDLTTNPPTTSTVAGGGQGTPDLGEIPASALAIGAFLDWRKAPGGGEELIMSGLRGKYPVVKIDLARSVVTAFAGGGSKGEGAVGARAIEAILARPSGLAQGPDGTLYISEPSRHRVLTVDPETEIVRVLAGTGVVGYSGDGGPAVDAQLVHPRGLTVDDQGRYLYVADADDNRVRRIELTGSRLIDTVAGDGGGTWTGDGDALQESVFRPIGVAVRGDALYIAEDGNHVIRKLQNGRLVTVAGKGGQAETTYDCPKCGGDGIAATEAKLYGTSAVAIDDAGNIYIGESGHNAVRMVDAGTGVITTMYQEQGLAPYGLAVTRGPNPKVYVSSNQWDEIREISGNPTFVAGDCSSSAALCALGDGGPAEDASIRHPYALTIGVSGKLLVADAGNNRIRQIDAPADGSSKISTIAGAGPSGDGGEAVDAALSNPEGVATFTDGSASYTFIADTLNHRVRRVDKSGTIVTVAGTGVAGFAGDRGPATKARLNNPEGLAVDSQGNLYIADTGNHRVRKVTPSGTIITVAGNPAGSYEDGNVATAAKLLYPKDVALDDQGNVYIADAGNNRIVRVDKNGILSTFAGIGLGAYSDGPALTAQLSFPEGLTVGADGAVYVADTFNDRIRKIENGIVSTVWFKPNSNPEGVVMDTAGDLFIAASSWDLDQTISEHTRDAGGAPTGNKIYKIRPDDPAGSERVIAGTGLCGLVGDGGLAKNSSLCGPSALAIGDGGDLFVADSGNNMVRRLRKAAARRLPNPAPVPQGPPDTTLTVNGSYTWQGQATTHSWALFGCADTLGAGRACDEERIDVTLPQGASSALLTIGLTAETPEVNDFDFVVIGPDGSRVARGYNTGDEYQEAEITQSGVYIVQVRAYTAANATYHGLAKLQLPTQGPAISVGQAFSWKGEVPFNIQPLDRCYFIFEIACDNTEVQVNVPAGGATLKVTIDMADVDDLDVELYGPDGNFVKGVYTGADPEVITVPVTQSGVYRVAVVAFLAFDGRYDGTIALS